MIESAERVGGPEALAMTRVLAVVGPEACGPPRRPWPRGWWRVACPTGRGPTRWVGRRPGLLRLQRPGRGPGGDRAAVLLRSAAACRVGADRPPAGRRGEGLLRRRAAAPAAQAVCGARRDARCLAARLLRAEVVEIVERALAARPCPVEPDQIEDVGIHLDLLRSRVDLLRQPAPPNRPARRRQPLGAPAEDRPAGAKPPIWRRIEVASDTSLEQLNDLIQAALAGLAGTCGSSPPRARNSARRKPSWASATPRGQSSPRSCPGRGPAALHLRLR